MRLTEEILQAYLDRALPPADRRAVEAHLAESRAAQTELARLRQNRQRLAAALDTLTPAPTDLSNSRRALLRLQTTLKQQPAQTPFGLTERIKPVFNRSKLKRYRPALTAATMVALVALLLSFAPVRAMAGNLLKILRVQNVQIVPINAANLENMQNNPELNDLMSRLQLEPQVISGNGEPQEVASLAEAIDMVDFAVARPVNPPAAIGELQTVMVQDKTVYNLQVDKDLLGAIFEAADIEVDLPDSLNDAPIILTQPQAVIQSWGAGNEETLHFVQMPSPEIEYPDDLDLQALGTAGLQLLGMPKAEAMALGATIDWANTLILPIPTDADMTVTEVEVGNDKGFLFTAKSDGFETALMWQSGAKTYFMGGAINADALLSLAASVK